MLISLKDTDHKTCTLLLGKVQPHHLLYALKNNKAKKIGVISLKDGVNIKVPTTGGNYRHPK